MARKKHAYQGGKMQFGPSVFEIVSYTSPEKKVDTFKKKNKGGNGMSVPI